MAGSDLTAELDRIKADTLSLAQTRTPSWGTVPKIQRVIDRTEHLLAAVEAVLKEADEFEANRPERLVTRSYAAECFRAAIVRGMGGGGDSGA